MIRICLLCALCALCLPAEAEALGALRIIAAALGKARLLHLNLSDNALGEKGIRAAAAAFSQQVRRGVQRPRWHAMPLPPAEALAW